MDEHDLFLAWSSGAADEASVAELDRRLRDDPACAKRFAAFCVEETALAAAARGAAAAKARHPRAAPASRGRRARTIAPRSWARTAAFAALAAGIVIAVAVIAHPRPAPPATIVAADGDARAAGHAARVGEAIADGEALTTGTDGRLSIGLRDGTRVTLSPGSDARFLMRGKAVMPALRDHTDGTGIALTRGELDATVAHRPPDDAFVVRTRDGEAVDLGTRFTVAVDDARTRLRVDEGRVRFVGVEVDAGWCADARAGDAAPPLPYRDLPGDPLPPGARALWRADGFAGWIGAPSRDDDGRRAIVATRPVDDEYDLEIRTPIAPAFTVERGTYVRFRYRATGLGRDAVLKLMLKRDDLLNYGGFAAPPRDGWTTLTVRVDDRLPLIDQPDQRLVAGTAIRQIAWLAKRGPEASADAAFAIDDVVVFIAPGAVDGATTLAP